MHIVICGERLLLLELYRVQHIAMHVAVPPGSCLRPNDKDSDLTN